MCLNIYTKWALKLNFFYKYSFKHIESWYSILRSCKIILGGKKKTVSSNCMRIMRIVKLSYLVFKQDIELNNNK